MRKTSLFILLLCGLFFGCTTWRTANASRTIPVYQVTLSFPGNISDIDIYPVLNAIPAAAVHTEPLPTGFGYPGQGVRKLSFQLRGSSAIQQLRQQLQSAGLPVIGFDYQEVSL